MRASFRFLPCIEQISPGDESEKSLPRHLLSESRSRFHPPLVIYVCVCVCVCVCVFLPSGVGRYLCMPSIYKCVLLVFLHCHRNESRIHGPATCDITEPSGTPVSTTSCFVDTIMFNLLLVAIKKCGRQTSPNP